MSEQKKNEKPKISFRRTVSNNLFMLRLLHRASPGRLAIEMGLWGLEAIIGFFSWQYMLRYIVNGIEEGKGFYDLAALLVAMTALNVVLVLIQQVWYQIFSGYYYQTTAKYFQELVYKKARDVDLACYENPDFYDKYMKALNETASRADGVASSCSMLIFDIVQFVANGTLLFAIDPVFLLFLVIPLLSSVFIKKQKKADFDRYEESVAMKRRCDYTRRTYYLGEYAKEMRLSAIYRVMAKRFAMAIKDTKSVIRKYGFKCALYGYIIEISREVLTFLGATVYAVYQTLVTGNILYGDCLVIINALTTLSWNITGSADTLFRFQEHALYIENLRFFLDYDPKICDKETVLPMKKGALTLENVSFRYDGADSDTLKHVSITCGEKEKIALVGHNGAGKSTLVKLMLRLYDPTDGKITLGGEDVRDYAVKEYRGAFSAVFQDFHVFSLSVSENILLRPMREGDEAVVDYALQRSGAATRVAEMPEGTATVLTREFDKNGTVLSGGETQKLAIAHAFTKENSFVILDEPTSALDPLAEYEM
ncbi:MAG: ABC transporter ATP-binding protein [Clostridia bacterium]|nr:ABC transporter ATP-binding protein [Clostridia bacterium]